MDDLQQQIAYYRARAGEYDEWFYRQGRYDRGEALNRCWFNEVETVMRALQTIGPVANGLELAAGTGNWTVPLASLCQQLEVVDASPEMIAINQHKVAQPHVEYTQADLFASSRNANTIWCSSASGFRTYRQTALTALWRRSPAPCAQVAAYSWWTRCRKTAPAR